MDIEQLQCILAIQEHKTFLDAAEALHRSQSSVSKSVQRLEQELGAPVFRRTTRRVEPTPLGEEILAYAARMVACYEGMLHCAEQHISADSSHLRIGSIYFGLTNRLVPYVANFLKLHPTMQVTIDESTTTPLLRQLEKRELDVVFVSSMYLQNGPKENYQTDPRYLSLSFSVDPYYVVVSRTHPLAGRRLLRYEDLAEESFITTDRTMDVYHKAMEKVFHACGASMKIAMQCTNIRSVLHMVSQNVGIAILSKLVVEDSDDLVLVPLENPMLRDTQMVILNQRVLPPHIKSFYHFIKTQLPPPESGLPAAGL